MPDIHPLLNRIRSLAPAPGRLPESTYRLQCHARFTFRDAAAILPYLRDLGISHVYSSPYLKARPGSMHGYDIVDHNAINPEIGSDADYNDFTTALQDHGLGHILDIVPNHMGVATSDNAWWNDVVENGPASRYAGHFDIAWRASLRPELHDKVLLPVLGEPYGDVLESGQLKLTFSQGHFEIDYHGRLFPVSPRGYARILRSRFDELQQAAGAESPAVMEYQSIMTAAQNLPDRSDVDPDHVAERAREKEIIKRRLASLAAESEPIRQFIQLNIERFNGRPGDTHSYDQLDDLLEHQCYRLAYWRVAPDEINYRRFFDINDLAALSMERSEVFEAAHALVLRLLAQGKVDGLRVDHPDGLYDPGQYFQRLQAGFLLAVARHTLGTEPEFASCHWDEFKEPLEQHFAGMEQASGTSREMPLYVVAEKILAADETLPPNWPVHGTSGYDFLSQINALFVDTAHAEAFTRIYREAVPQAPSHYSDLVYQNKLLILNVSLASELHMLTQQLDRLAQRSRKSRDFTRNTLRSALREVIACFPVYRSYITNHGVRDEDRRYVETAVRRAAARNPLISRRVFQFIADMILQRPPESFSDDDRFEQRRFAGKFQQVTAPVTAKGIEDTAFYVYNRLVSLNEVGGSPDRFGITPQALHRFNQNRKTQSPYALSPLSTHDTKRSEDVRARINVLSEMPDEWLTRVTQWQQLNAQHRRNLDEIVAPDPNEEYLLYQTLIGAWPLQPYSPHDYSSFVQRIQDYMLKVIHEAKVHSSWINPNEPYDSAVREFTHRILDEQASPDFLNDFRTFQHRVAQLGLINSLAQTLLKFTCPGVPDTYQGTELWDFSLVDPDNRRAVDYERRYRMLRELQAASNDDKNPLGLARELAANMPDGRIKLYVTFRSLHCRREHSGLFSSGDYIPVAATGPRAKHIFSFYRSTNGAQAVVAVPRLIASLPANPAQIPMTDPAVWSDTAIQLPDRANGGQWRNVFTGERLKAKQHQGGARISASALFGSFPVALLIQSDPSDASEKKTWPLPG